MGGAGHFLRRQDNPMDGADLILWPVAESLENRRGGGGGGGVVAIPVFSMASHRQPRETRGNQGKPGETKGNQGKLRDTKVEAKKCPGCPL